MQNASDIAQPGWPDPRPDLIDFALTFLEADVMLFCSGYAKRHLIRRLQQSPLTDADVTRIERMLKRAITEGRGLEEARTWRRLAAHLVVRDRLPGFEGWVAEQASGPVIAMGDAVSGSGAVTRHDARPTEPDLFRPRARDRARSRWGNVLTAMRRHVRAGHDHDDRANKAGKTAFRTLAAIRDRRRSEPGRVVA